MSIPLAVQLEGFVWKHFKHYLTHPIKDFHRELMSLTQCKKVAIAAPRNHAKTTYFTVLYAMFTALEKPGSSIVIVSSTADIANQWLLKMRKEFETNQSLIKYYGPQNKKGKWAEDVLYLDNGSIIEAKGAGKALRGLRKTLIICDDLETNEIVANPRRLQEFEKWFFTDVMGICDTETQVIVVGTLLDNESFLASMVHKPRHGWVSRFYQAIKEDGTPLWSDRWPLSALNDIITERGRYYFDQEYMNCPLPPDMRTFKEDQINFFEKEPEGCVYFTTIDPAIEIGKEHDFTAIVTCAVDPDENIYVVDVRNRKLLPKETVDQIFDVFKKYKPATIGIETIGFQKLLKYEIDRQKQDRGLYPVVKELKSEGRRKQLRIEALQPRFECGKVHIRSSQKELLTQLVRFPSPRCHDDIIDALAYQLDILRPATEQQTRLNPESFIALFKSDVRAAGDWWGNQNLRNKDYGKSTK